MMPAELELHARYEERRKLGEWFDLASEEVDTAIGYMEDLQAEGVK